MDYLCLHDKQEIEPFLKGSPYLHMYSIGDLDDFFWPYTIWYGSKTNGKIDAVALLYVGMALPTLLALSDDREEMTKLIASIEHLLPNRFYAHCSPGVELALSSNYLLETSGEHYKMGLLNSGLVQQGGHPDVVRLSGNDLPAIQTLYAESYPGNWFDERMLETNQYMGVLEEGRLVSIAGIHVYSPQYKVAALGNITTHPSARGKGYGTRVTAALSSALLEEGMQVGLNVKADNKAAITCYKRIGFEVVASYGEFFVQRKALKVDGDGTPS